jgi:hypothetical protein
MNTSLESRINKCAITGPKHLNAKDSGSEDDNLYLNSDEWYPVESGELGDDNDNGINSDCNESQQFRGDEFPADDEFEYEPSIFERPSFGRFGHLYWLKIQMMMALWRLRRLIRGIKKDNEAEAATPAEFPL